MALKTVPPGIYVPIVTFFNDDAQQSLDLKTYDAHIRWLGTTGVAGITVQGSTGEAACLSREEKNAMTAATRKALDAVSPNKRLTVIVGTCGAQSTAQAIEAATDAKANGGDFALVLPPNYYANFFSTADIIQFYHDVADASPIPILIYSYPFVSGGIDMNTETLAKIAVHPNIVGIKHTDHSLSKQSRMAANRSSFGGDFTVLGGASDYLLATLSVGGQGAITGLGNIAPRAVQKAFDLYQAGKHQEALEIAQVISVGEWALLKGGLHGTKYATAFWNELPKFAAKPRKPLGYANEENQKWQETELKELMALERKLEAEAGAKGPYGKSL